MNERDTMLVQWLGEAHTKEAELEGDLTAHIALTEKKNYKKRLKEHLKETREHKRAVARRIKQLGGAPTNTADVRGVPTAITEAAGKGMAAVKGQIGTARALVTGTAGTHLRNAQEELREEHVEIAIYTRLEALADAVGDDETAKLARRIRREEERMAKYLSAQLPRLVRDVVRDEVPRAQRKSGPAKSRTAESQPAKSRAAKSKPAKSRSANSGRAKAAA